MPCGAAQVTRAGALKAFDHLVELDIVRPCAGGEKCTRLEQCCVSFMRAFLPPVIQRAEKSELVKSGSSG